MYQCTVFDDNYAFVYASICMHNPGVVDTYDDGRHSSLNSILYYIYTPKITYIYIIYIYICIHCLLIVFILSGISMSPLHPSMFRGGRFGQSTTPGPTSKVEKVLPVG